MTQEDTILVATVVHPERRFRIPRTKFDEVNAAAKKLGNDSPFIEQEEDCEGGPAYDNLDEEGKKEVKANQEERQKRIDEKAKANKEEKEEE